MKVNVTLANFDIKSCYARLEGYGGSIIYSHCDLDSTGLPNVSRLSVYKVCEIATIRFGGFVIVSIYRPPQSNSDEFLLILESIFTDIKQSVSIVLGGDFNINFDSDNSKKSSLLDFFHCYNLIPVDNFKTRGNSF